MISSDSTDSTGTAGTVASGVVEVTATAMAAGGDAIAREPSGRVVFVEGALPGERVRIEFTQQRKDFARARVIEVVDASPHRVDAPCPSVALGCGGCQWQHIDPAAQSALKRDIVADALRRIAHIPNPPLDDEVGVAPPTRTTLRLGVRAEDGRAGLRKRHAHDLVPIDGCLVAHPLLLDLLAESRFDGADEVTLRVGAATGDRLVMADPTAEGITTPDDVAVVTNDEPHAAVREDVAGRRWQVSAASFFQPGPDAAELLVESVRAAAGPAQSVLDAYAGVGLLGGVLEPERLVAVESSSFAVADARVNLADLDAAVVEGEVADALADVPRPERAFDVVIADPARPGLGRSAAGAVAAVGAPRLVLVSCDPASFARDVGLLRDLGYTLGSARVLDLFPHTFHVEVAASFERD